MMIETLFIFLPESDGSFTCLDMKKFPIYLRNWSEHSNRKGMINLFFFFSSTDVNAIKGIFGSLITFYFRSKKVFFV